MIFDNNLDNQVIKLNIENSSPATIEQIVNIEINEYINSVEYLQMLAAERYYKNETDVLFKPRKIMFDEDQNKTVLSDNRIPHDFFATLVDQKIQYLLGKDWTIDSDNDKYTEQINAIFDDKFRDKMRRIAADAITKSNGWIFINLNNGKLEFVRISPLNAIPLWVDNDHTELDAFIYFYSNVEYEKTIKKIKKYAQYWDKNGVVFFEGNDFSYKQVSNAQPTISAGEKLYNWEKIPFVPLKYNDNEVSLLQKVKHMIDDYDRICSTNSNALADDANKILVINNYGGTDLADFRFNLLKNRAVKINDNGSVNVLDTTVNISNTEPHLDRTKKDIFTFGRGVDNTAEFGANASSEARQYQYALLDMDCNFLEKGCKDFLTEILWFVNSVYKLPDQKVKFVFNRDILTNENTSIDMCVKSQSVQGLSMKTILSNHPWVTDVDSEIKEWEKNNKEEEQNNDLGTGKQDEQMG